MLRIAAFIGAAAILAGAVVSAQPKNAVAEGIAAEAHTHATNMVGAAEAMPADAR